MIYYTTDVEKQVTADELATIITSLKAFESSTQQGSAQASRTETGQSECYYSFREGGYTLHFIGLRLSDKNRVIAAVVVGGEEVHHFALEFTAHEYDKTLVGNSIRLENWKERLTKLYFLFLHHADSACCRRASRAKDPFEKSA